jgi:hypothetical protein
VLLRSGSTQFTLFEVHWYFSDYRCVLVLSPFCIFANNDFKSKVR